MNGNITFDGWKGGKMEGKGKREDRLIRSKL
jgi:hypothetical protein